MPRRRFLSAVLGTPPGAGTVRTLTAGGKDLTRPGETKDILDATGAPLLAGYYAALGRLGVTGLPGRSWTVERAVREGYSRVVWVYRTVEAIGGAQQRLPIVVLDDRTNEPIPDHPLPAMLNSRKAASANALESGRVYRKRLSQQTLLSPRGAFTYAKVSRGGTPLSYRLLPPDRTRLIPDSQGRIDHYEVDPVGGGKPRSYPADQVRWTREPHPTDPFAGMTPLEAAGLTVELDHFVRLYNRQVLANDGRPGGIVGITNPETGKGEAADPAEMDRVEKRFAGGPLDAGRLVVVDGTVSYEDLGGGLRDGAYSSLRMAGKDEILVAFATPESQIGRASGSTFANAAEEKEAWYLVTIMPHVETVDDTYVDEVEDGQTLTRDYSTVDVLDRAAKARREEMRTEVKEALRTPLSYAQETDQHVGTEAGDFPDVPATRALWLPSGKVPVAASDDDTEAAAGLAPVGTPPPPEEGAGGGGAPGEGPPGTGPGGSLRVEDLPPEVLHALFSGSGETKRLPRGRASHLRAVGDRGGDDSDDAEGERDRVVTAVTDALATLHARLVDRSLARLRGVKARQGTRHWVPPVEGKQLDPDRVVDEKAWADAARTLAEQTLPPAAADAAVLLRERLDAAGSAPPPGPTEPTAQEKRRAALLAVAAYAVLTRLTPILGFAAALEVAEAAGEAVEALVKIAVARALALRTLVVHAEERDAAAVTAGAPARGVAPVAESIREWAAEAAAWAQRTAEETVAAAIEGARHTVLTAAGERLARVWRTRRDSKVRPQHRAAEGQTVHGSDPFIVGGEAARYPGDPRLSPGNRINCRCRVGYTLRVAGQRYLTFGASEAAPDLGTKALLGMRVGPMPVEVKASLWDAHKHPRDRHGRFIRVAEFVRLASGETGRVLAVTAGTVEVRTDAGRTVRVTGREVERVDRPHVQLAGVARSTEHLAPPAPPGPTEVQAAALTLSATPNVGRVGAAPVIPDPAPRPIDCVTCGRVRPYSKFPTTKPGLRSTECRECRDTRRAGLPAAVPKGGTDPAQMDPVAAAREALRDLDYHSVVPVVDAPEIRKFRTTIEHNEREIADAEARLRDLEAEYEELVKRTGDVVRGAGLARTIDLARADVRKARETVAEQKKQQAAYIDLFRQGPNYVRETDSVRVPGDLDLVDGGPGPLSIGHLKTVLAAGRVLDAEAQSRITRGWEQAGIDEAALRRAENDAAIAVEDALTDHDNLLDAAVERILASKSLNRVDAVRDAHAEPEVREAEERLTELTDAGIEASRARRRGASARAAFAAQVYGDLLAEVRPTGGEVRVSLSKTAREPGYVDRPAGKLRRGDVLSGSTADGTAVVVARVVPDPDHGATVVYYEHAPGVEARFQSFESVPRRIRPDDPEDLDDNERGRLAAFTAAQEHYPTGWTDAVNEYLRSGSGGLYLSETNGRGGYNPVRQEMNLSPTPTAYEGVPLETAATHELGHVAEQALPLLRVLEWAFMWHRTSTGKPGRRKRVGRNALKRMSSLRGVPRHLMADDEVGRGDKFPDPYSGREYRDGPSAPYELLTTAAEALFHGGRYADDDPEMRAFGLGLLATVGPDPEPPPVTLGAATVPGPGDGVEPHEGALRGFYSGLGVEPPRYAPLPDGEERDRLAWYEAQATEPHIDAAGKAKAGVAAALAGRLRGHEGVLFDILAAGSEGLDNGPAYGDTRTVAIYDPLYRGITVAFRAEDTADAKASVEEHNAGQPTDLGPEDPVPHAYRGDDPALAAVIREAGASALIESWALSSNDAHVRGLALQRAVVDEFGIADPHPWDVGADVRLKVDEDYLTHEALYRAFVRAQYDETQAWLAAHGITNVVLHRGFNLTEFVNEPERLPDWTLSDEGEVDLTLRPASAFSLDPTVAEVFAQGGEAVPGIGGGGGDGAMISTVVPADRILSTPRSGWGCLAEQEVVVLAGPTRGRAERFGSFADPDFRAEAASGFEGLSLEQAAATPAGALRDEDDVTMALTAEQRNPTSPQRRAALIRRCRALGMTPPAAWVAEQPEVKALGAVRPGSAYAYPSNATEDWLAPIFDVRTADGRPVGSLAALAAVTALPRRTAARVLLGSPARHAAPPDLVAEAEAVLAG